MARATALLSRPFEHLLAAATLHSQSFGGASHDAETGTSGDPGPPTPVLPSSRSRRRRTTKGPSK